MALRPEEVEEEGRTEDGSDVDADKDVVGCDADEVVVVHVRRRELGGHVVLLVDIVCAILLVVVV
jgi:hypothetical protein